MRLLPAAYEGGDGGDGYYAAAVGCAFAAVAGWEEGGKRVLAGHLKCGELGCVECAGEVCGLGCGPEGGRYAGRNVSRDRSVREW